MRGYGGDPYDPRRQQQMEDDNPYFPGNAINNHSIYPVQARLPYPNALAASGYFQMPHQQQHVHNGFVSPRHTPHEPEYTNFSEIGLQQQQLQFGRIAPTHNLHDGLVPPNLIPQHPHPLNVYDLPTSPLRQSVTSPGNIMDQQQQRIHPKVRYDERLQVNLRGPDASRQEERYPKNDKRDTDEEDEEGKRYQEIYHQVFARHSRTPSEARTQTEHTRGTPYAQTTTSGSTTRSSSSSRSSSGVSSSFSEVEDWEENIRSTFHEMAGNLKKIGGIHCNQAGPDSTELQLKLNLPVPMQYMDQLDMAAKQGLNQLDMAAKQGLNTAMATLSPKKCNMQYGYDNLDEGVFEMEQRFVGTMNELQGNMMPVYKSLFQSQSDESSVEEEEEDSEMDDGDEEESTYEDPRFLARHTRTSRNESTEKKGVFSVALSRGNIPVAKETPLISRVPSHIIITDSPSSFSSVDSWRLSLTVATLPKVVSKQGDIPPLVVNDYRRSFDVTEPLALGPKKLCGDTGRDDNRESADWIPAATTKLVMVDRESPIDEKDSKQIPRQDKSKLFEKKPTASGKEIKPKSKKNATSGEIPDSIDLVLPSDEIVETFSEITTDIPDSDSSQPSAVPVEKPLDDTVEAEMDMSSLDGNPRILVQRPQSREQRIAVLENNKSKLPEGDELMESCIPVKKSTENWSSQAEADKREVVGPKVNQALPDRNFTEGDELMAPCIQKNGKLGEMQACVDKIKVEKHPEHASVDETPKMQKPTHNPLYLRAIRLKKKAAFGGDEGVRKHCPLAGEDENFRPIQEHGKVDSLSLADVKEISGPAQKSINDPGLPDETKLDRAINEIFGASRDTPDGGVGKPIRTAQTTLNELVGYSDDDTPKPIAESDQQDNVMEEAEGDVPDDERSSSASRHAGLAPDDLVRSLDAGVETVSMDIPEDERLDSTVKGDPLIHKEETDHQDPQVTHKSVERNQETLNNLSMEEPFDAPFDASVSVRGQIESGESLLHSDQSFQSAKQETISEHSTPISKLINNDVEGVETNERMKLDGTPTYEPMENLTESSRLRSSFETQTESRRLPLCAETLVDSRHPRFSEETLSDSARPGLSVDAMFNAANQVGSQSQIPNKSTDDATSNSQEATVTNPEPEIPFDMETDMLEIAEDGDMRTNATLSKSNKEAVAAIENEAQVNEAEPSICSLGIHDADVNIVTTEEPGDLPLCSEQMIPVTGAKEQKNDDKLVAHTEKDREECSTEPLPIPLFLSRSDAKILRMEHKEESEDPFPRRTHTNRAALYEVQGFDEYCKKISSLAAEHSNLAESNLPAKQENVNSTSVSQSSHDDTLEKSSNSVHCHQRTLDINLEDPEESSIDDEVAPENKATTNDEIAETSSIDGDADDSEVESERSTTSTEEHFVSSSQSAESGASNRSENFDDRSRPESSYSDSSESKSSYMEEQSDIDTNASSEHESERKDVLQDMKAVQKDHDLHMSATRRLRNQIDAEQDHVEIRYLSQHTRATLHPLSSEASIKTADTQRKSMPTTDETLRSNRSKPFVQRFDASAYKESTPMAKSILAAYSMDTHLTSPLTTSFTMDTPLPAVSTISTMRTFDHETVSSGQQSLLRQHPTYDSLSTEQSPTYLRSGHIGKSAAIAVTAVYNRPTKHTSSKESSFRIISLISRVILSILLFLFEWAKYFAAMCRKKRQAKIECAPARLGLRQTDQVLRREEIQERSMDSIIHRTNANPRSSFYQHNRQPYLLHHRDQEQHCTATMTMNPPLPVFEDDDDEVGTCVSSIVPESHYSDRPLAWKVHVKKRM